MLEVKELTKSYKGKKVVDDLSFHVEKGSLFALLGSNGAGKSTTIKMILGLVRKDNGSIEMPDGIRFGYSPETPYFPPFLSGREVLTYYGQLQKIAKETNKEECEALLSKVGLEDDKTKVKNYSKGMLQRLALAQALLGDPDLLILDEPCAGLDAIGRLEMLEIIRKLKGNGKTVIMNTHILTDIEKVCNEGVILKKGKVVHRFHKDDLDRGQNLEDIFIQAVGM